MSPDTFFFFFFFNCYLADPRPTSGHSRGDSLTNPMLIAAFYPIRPEGHRMVFTQKKVANNHFAVCCDICNLWLHIKCNNITKFYY